MNYPTRLAYAFLLTPLLLADPPPAPVTVTIKTKPAQMKYDLEKINAAPGAQITLTLQNEDDLPHNLVVCKAKDDGANDKGLEVATAAWNLGEAGMKQEWIPENPRILAHTKMVNPHQSETITFNAPAAPGDYPYVCTFPGHAMVMNGTLHIGPTLPLVKNLHYRYYIGDDILKLPDFSKLTAVEEGPLPSGKMDISLHQKERDYDYAYEFEGALDCPRDDEYTFEMGSDDGSQLWIDGKNIIKIDGIHPTKFNTKKLKLTKGEHNIKVQYFQGSEGARFFLSWKSPNYTEQSLGLYEAPPETRLTENEKFAGLPLVVNQEARIYRNFIEGSSPRGIAVGYPGNVNICWDADQMNLALVWQGVFMDAKRHWTGRGTGNQPPLGYGVAKLGMEHSLAILDSNKAPWTSAQKSDQPHDPAYTFHGYELDAQRQPTFRYDFKGVAVMESFVPEGDQKSGTARIKRVVKLISNKPVDNLYFLALSGSIETKNNAYIFDKTVCVSIKGGTPLPRKSAGRDEVLLPVVFTNEKAGVSAEFTIDYSWNLP